MIRKISIGVDYKNAMHYTVGQPFGRLTVKEIKSEDDGYHLYVTDEYGDFVEWKYWNNAVPVHVEFDIEAF